MSGGGEAPTHVAIDRRQAVHCGPRCSIIAMTFSATIR
jgi:hypothetical protein